MSVLSITQTLVDNQNTYFILSLILLVITLVGLIVSKKSRIKDIHIFYSFMAIISILALVLGMTMVIAAHRRNENINLVVAFLKLMLPSFLSLCFSGLSASISK